MNQLPRGHIECPARGCEDGLFRVDTTNGIRAIRHDWYQCRACNGLGYISDPTLRKVVVAFIGPQSAEWQELLFAVLDDGAVVTVESNGTFPGTLAHREAENVDGWIGHTLPPLKDGAIGNPAHREAEDG